MTGRRKQRTHNIVFDKIGADEYRFLAIVTLPRSEPGRLPFAINRGNTNPPPRRPSSLPAIMRFLIIILSACVFLGCQHSNKRPVMSSDTKSDPCQNIPKEIDTVIIFGSVQINSHWKDFDSTVKFLESKGSLKQTIIKDRVKIDNWKDYCLRIPIDTCNHQIVTKNFILKNVTATTCLFKSKIALKNNKELLSKVSIYPTEFCRQ